MLEKLKTTPTRQAYEELQVAYDFFNDTLFDGRLPDCLITYQRKKTSLGYFSPERWDGSKDRKADEIALNPTYFDERGVADTLSTLVHEMVHLEQHHFGTPSRRGYHNREWASWMERVGLIPSDTGEPGGKRTGQKMSHYIAAGGSFEADCGELLKRGFGLSWVEHVETELEDEAEGKNGTEVKKKLRAKFTCLKCGLNAWAKPSANLACGDCSVHMVEAGVPVPKSDLA